MRVYNVVAVICDKDRVVSTYSQDRKRNGKSTTYDRALAITDL